MDFTAVVCVHAVGLCECRWVMMGAAKVCVQPATVMVMAACYVRVGGVMGVGGDANHRSDTLGG